MLKEYLLIEVNDEGDYVDCSYWEYGKEHGDYRNYYEEEFETKEEMDKRYNEIWEMIEEN